MLKKPCNNIYPWLDLPMQWTTKGAAAPCVVNQLGMIRFDFSSCSVSLMYHAFSHSLLCVLYISS